MPIPEVKKIWMNGKLVDWADAQVHLLTHALHYGSGVFEGIRAYKTARGPAVFRLTDHLQRLERSAKMYYMELPYPVAEMVQATKDVIKANDLEHCYIRPIVYRGYGEMGLYPLGAPTDAAIAVWPWGTYLGDEGVKHGVRTKISSIKSLDANAMTPAAKSCGQYLNSQLAKIEVVKAGYEEAIMLNNAGFVTQGTGENIFMIRGGKVVTPPIASGLLEGITRDTVMTISAALGYPVVERDFTRSDLVIADEAFFTGTAAEVVPIREVDDHLIGEPGPALRHHPEGRHAAGGHVDLVRREGAHRAQARRARHRPDRGRLSGVEPQGPRVLRDHGRRDARQCRARRLRFDAPQGRVGRRRPDPARARRRLPGSGHDRR
jgi:branched-chain amino acid aminotransferase